MTSSGSADPLYKYTGFFLLNIKTVIQVDRKFSFGRSKKVIVGNNIT
jgi:hypothetical protein